MVKLLYVCTIILLLTSWVKCSPKHHELENYDFETYKKDFNKDYHPSSEEHKLRETLFNTKLNDIKEHNSGSSSYKKGIN